MKRIIRRLVTMAVWATVTSSAMSSELTELNCLDVGIRCFHGADNTMSLSRSGDVLTSLDSELDGYYVWNRSTGGRYLSGTGPLSDDGRYIFTTYNEGYLIRNSTTDGSQTRINIDIPGDLPSAWVSDVSADGSLMVGNILYRPESGPPWQLVKSFIWSEGTGIRFLEPAPDFDYISLLVSANGQQLVGTAENWLPGPPSAFAYLADSFGPATIERLNDEKPRTTVTQLADDGSTAYGRALPTLTDHVGLSEMFYWTPTEGMVGLGFDASPRAITPDGHVVVGSVHVEGQYDNLGPPPLGQKQLSARLRTPALFWSKTDGQLEVGNGVLYGVTSDGNVAVGGTADETGTREAIVYHRRSSTRSLQDVLIDEYGLSESLNGWTLEAARGISANGLTIAGIGKSPTTEEAIWLVDLDYPITWVYPGNVVRDEMLDVNDINELTSAVVAGATLDKYDLNDDQLVNVADVQQWVRDIFGTWTGDANLDGEFNSSDLVNVFQAGKYELDTAATWSEGDWSADGRFTTRDLVAAFQDGGYEQGARASATAIPEPTSGILAVAALLGLFVGRRWQAR